MPVWSAVALAVLATLLFQPARSRLEAAADRWVFGRREQPLNVVHGFGETLRDMDRANDIADQLARAATTAADLTWVRVETATAGASEIGVMRDGPVVDMTIMSGTERLGDLHCQPFSGSQLKDEERSALAALNGQAALAISRAQLASRIVRAQELERRRIERNIHDGAQQELIALVAKLGLARSQNGATDYPRLLTDLQGEIGTILTNLRDLAQGVHPSVLSDGGLAVAVEDRCSRLTNLVKLEISPTLRAVRLDQDIETAAYFVVAEGLTNMMRHSGADSASVSLELQGPQLTVTVADDGGGFESEHLRTNGGLHGLSDRLQALGGELVVESAPGQGTRVRARLPVRAVASS